MQKKVLYWGDVEEMVANIATQISKDAQEFTHILALARGGLVPSALLAHALDLRPVHSLSVYSYRGTVQDEPELISDWPEIDDKNLLIVDDLVDSGKTVKMIKEHYPNAKVAVLIAKPEGQAQADFFAEKCTQDAWIDFPWERDLIKKPKRVAS